MLGLLDTARRQALARARPKLWQQIAKSKKTTNALSSPLAPTVVVAVRTVGTGLGRVAAARAEVSAQTHRERAEALLARGIGVAAGGALAFHHARFDRALELELAVAIREACAAERLGAGRAARALMRNDTEEEHRANQQ
jgi:hypothetical protein